MKKKGKDLFYRRKIKILIKFFCSILKEGMIKNEILNN
jgi:hypothetical protein